MRKALAVVLLLFCCSTLVLAQSTQAGAAVRLPGLLDDARVVRDTNGIAHIFANNDHDLAFLQGYTHAEDRFFQMDYYRHLASGTLAEMVGSAALPTDVQLRTIGIRRSAAPMLTAATPRARAFMEAYADGINAYITTHPLPPEYAALGITQVDPWTTIDSAAIAKLLVFQLSYDLLNELDSTILALSYQQAGAMFGFDGAKLFSDDLFRSAPFDSASTVPDAMGTSALANATSKKTSPAVDDKAATLIKNYVNELNGLPFFQDLKKRHRDGSSNVWAVSGKLTDNGFPLLASDPHLDLDYPSIWYPVHLSAGKIDVIGSGFAGTPTIITGHNSWIAWGSTVTYDDVTDFFQEQLVPDATSPSGLSTLYKGAPEHVIPVPQTFRTRVAGQLVTVPPGNGIPAFTLIVPRRSNGPIISFDQTTGTAISVQWTGYSGSREIDATLVWAEAKTPEEFAVGVRYFNAPQNFAYADRKGNIGYFQSGEIPVREDLQANTVNGLPPWLLRNGQGGNEWLPVQHPQPQQALPYEILPFEEMPHVLNPPAGMLVNGNNDPAGLTLDNDPLNTLRPGGGLYYLSYQFNFGSRAGRITRLLQEAASSRKLNFLDMKKFQADTAIIDAEFFVPFITQAFSHAQRQGAPIQLAALAGDAAVAEAVNRLQAWDHSSPTGLSEGYDAFQTPGKSVSASDVANSVAATLYSVWRGQFAINVLDSKLTGLPLPDDPRTLTSLRHLLETFADNHGVGASGIDFFALPGITSADDRRDIYILQAMKSALTMLAGDDFKAAFANSTNQEDYRWGKLHRIVFQHPLGSIFNVPPAGGFLSAPLPNLAGLPVDSAFPSVDSTILPIRGTHANAFMFDYGPSQRFVAEGLPSGMIGVNSLPGGISGVVGSPSYYNLLPQYLVNETYNQLFGPDELQGSIDSVTKYQP